ncbi:DUF4360 domain-containing protein [Amycolatopsis sp. CA-230715]|uniref:DUF4360 domain-containing protein n=1 Tax=Amycolatopsis sp. CA-230715 TaxID=2745196 RepID=UPI001C022334|nr:DUF4360 domain-containing protein [Amycolatopsis sp. CA-230715]QWF83502.1 hypothetical protein HUW46_06943 [Amycolatopsis sp. CA-230715]
MTTIMTVASLITSLLAPPPPATGPPTGRVVIDIITVNGSGCPPGMASVAVASDNTSVVVTYPGAASAADERHNCQVRLLIHPPAGFTYTITEADYRGYLFLDNGVRAALSMNYYLRGAPSPPVTRSFTGPLATEWQIVKAPDIPSPVPCGETPVLDSTAETRLAPSTPDPRTNFATLESTTFRLTWTTCPTPTPEATGRRN